MKISLNEISDRQKTLEVKVDQLTLEMVEIKETLKDLINLLGDAREQATPSAGKEIFHPET